MCQQQLHSDANWEFQFVPDEYIQQASQKGSSLYFKFDETSFIKHVLQQVHQDRDAYGWSHIAAPAHKTVLIDYSSPNIAKPFHAGHLRSTIIGSFTKRIHEALGYRVIGINYLGDWGKQYGKQQCCLFTPCFADVHAQACWRWGLRNTETKPS